MRVALVLLLVACGGTRLRAPRATDLAARGPATLEARNPREGEPRDAKVRVWVDASVRALPQWKDKITDQLDHASQLLTPLLGVQLRVERFAEWNLAGAPDPGDALAALAAVDPGEDVAWVIGYVAPGDTASKAMSDLGRAELLGRHVVVRAWSERAETASLAASLPELSAGDRAEVLAAHERHKQTVALLHQLGRTLGAVDEHEPSWIGSPAYAPAQATVSDRNRELMQIGVDRRLAGDATPEVAHALLEHLDRQTWGGWIAASRDETLARLRAIVTASQQGQAAPDLPVAAVEPVERIRSLAQRGEHSTALAELDNLLVAYPGNAAMFQLRCELLLGKPGVVAPATREACARAAEAAPGDPRPHLTVGEALARGGDVAGARAELTAAAARIVAAGAGGEAQHRKLVAIYRAMGALTWTEEAIAAARLEGDPVAAEVASARARNALPRGSTAVRPEDEGAYLEAMRVAREHVYGGRHAAAAAEIAAGRKRWPRAAGFATVRCDLALRDGDVGGARAACDQALAVDPAASWALYLAGVIALKDTSAAGTKRGVELLKRAIEADPDLGQAWRTLAKAYARGDDKAALDQLSTSYQARFGTPLPR